MASDNRTDPVPTSAVLLSIAKHIANKCGQQNKAFLDCKAKDRNPAACLKPGDAVIACAADVLKEVNSKCPKELKAYYQCLDYYSNNFLKCRREQKALEEACPPNA